MTLSSLDVTFTKKRGEGARLDKPPLGPGSDMAAREARANWVGLLTTHYSLLTAFNVR
jgi:hypothetical protein